MSGDSNSLAPHITRLQFGQIVETLLDRGGDPARLAPLFAPEAEWTLNGDQSYWSYAGRRWRRESILDYFRAFSVEFEQKAFRIHEMLIEGEQACVRYEVELRHRGTGRANVLQGLNFIRFEGEVVVEAHEFIDSALLFRLRQTEP
ncbi:nuclear transport factor 2 family protein [Rhodoblastus sp.]|uniref:nuclear transport factor 2 family protein n=1 Tax=Rhodoblastus sp. TaxID=1962975 RepID=UPI00260E7990|nr:nuclear transport factor 2 family protein [Rhodoblastus sp.]